MCCVNTASRCCKIQGGTAMEHTAPPSLYGGLEYMYLLPGKSDSQNSCPMVHLPAYQMKC